MWLFLAAEIIFFGAIIMCFVYYRCAYPRDFGLASNHTKVVLGTLNTAVLLSSSLFVALAVHAAREGKSGGVVVHLLLCVVLGIVFLGIKFTEYHLEYREGLLPGRGFAIRGVDLAHAKLFFLFYFIMTGIHALHVLIGIGLLSVIAWKALVGAYSPRNYNAVEVSGLYWHFVDVVWIFLFPLLYLMGRHLYHG
jgi:cytochrome c oxidase subunit 3